MRKLDIGVLVTIALAVIGFAFWLGQLHSRVGSLENGTRIKEEQEKAIAAIQRASEELSGAKIKEEQEKAIAAIQRAAAGMACAGSIVVDPTAGWQNSGVEVRKGQQVRIAPSGHIHLAVNHLYNLQEVLKPVIIKNLPRRPWSLTIRSRYPYPGLSERNKFFRDWLGPEGDRASSDMLDNCKLRRDLNWGQLLVAVIPTSFSDRVDPLQVLKDASLAPSDIVGVIGPCTLTAPRDGYLAFIVNDAVLSPSADPGSDAREFYTALLQAKEALSSDPRHQLFVASLPLVFFSDNAGFFRVAITYP